jgi:hypothetical protein
MFKCVNNLSSKNTASDTASIIRSYSFNQTYFLHLKSLILKHQHKFHGTKFCILGKKIVINDWIFLYKLFPNSLKWLADIFVEPQEKIIWFFTGRTFFLELGAIPQRFYILSLLCFCFFNYPVFPWADVASFSRKFYKTFLYQFTTHLCWRQRHWLQEKAFHFLWNTFMRSQGRWM